MRLHFCMEIYPLMFALAQFIVQFGDVGILAPAGDGYITIHWGE